jgi:hypothetical protein
LESRTTGGLILEGFAAPNLDYQIQTSATLGTGDGWQTIATVRSDENGHIEYPVTVNSERMFFRIVFATPPP